MQRSDHTDSFTFKQSPDSGVLTPTLLLLGNVFFFKAALGGIGRVFPSHTDRDLSSSTVKWFAQDLKAVPKA